ncbi:MAG: hypothetical protein ACLTZY_02890 [Alistipes indistinctus]
MANRHGSTSSDRSHFAVTKVGALRRPPRRKCWPRSGGMSSMPWRMSRRREDGDAPDRRDQRSHGDERLFNGAVDRAGQLLPEQHHPLERRSTGGGYTARR